VSAPAESEAWRPKGIVAVLDTSTLVRAWLSREEDPRPARDVMRLAGQVYDSFTSPAILDEAEEVLVRPRFGVSRGHVRLWLDAFLRMSHQVFPEVIPGGDPAAVGGDVEDLPVLNTAYAAAASGEEMSEILAAARLSDGWFIVSENTRHFPPGRNVHGWQFITAHLFLRLLHSRASAEA
jgi:predicted nucleic acid-binding protein